MAAVTLKDVRFITGEYEVTSDHNQLSLDLSRDTVETTTFGASSRSFIPGLMSGQYTLNGFFSADGTDEINDIQAAQQSSTVIVTFVAPDGGAGDPAYSFRRVESTITPFGGSVGDAASFQASGVATGDMFRGTVLEAGTTARSSTSTSATYQLGAQSSGETAYAAMHVLATSGSPTLDVVIQRDDNSGMSSATTHLTFTQATDVGSQFISSTTATTDDYWRASWTFGGTGTITFLVTFGIA